MWQDGGRTAVFTFKHPLTVRLINALRMCPHKCTYFGAGVTQRVRPSLAWTWTGDTFDHTPAQVPGPRIHLCGVTVVTEFLLCCSPVSRDFDGNSVPCVRLHRSGFVTHDRQEEFHFSWKLSARNSWQSPKTRAPSEESWRLHGHRIRFIHLFLFW